MKKLGCRVLIATALGLFGGLTTGHAGGEVVYIQAAKTELKAGPQMQAPTLMPLVRGDELEVLEKKDAWIRVRCKGKEGWVSKLFTSTHKPVGAASLGQEVQVNLEKASRRRTSSYSVTASTRGLNADERVREGREQFRPDYDALDKLEAFKLKDNDIERFRKEGGLQ